MVEPTAKSPRIDAPLFRIGTAGWGIPRAIAAHFPAEGSTLARYAAVFNAVEINSTFYRLPRASTLERWRDATPAHFRFSVKAPQTITHHAGLVDCDDQVDRFLDLIALLGERLGPILVQLPPKLAFDAAIAGRFFEHLTARFNGAVVCEPRHVTWFTPQAETLLRQYQIARVAADPTRHPTATTPGGSGDIAYWRLHGSPQMHASSYEDTYLRRLSQDMRGTNAQEAWCIFDNTMFGAAAENARTLSAMMSDGRQPRQGTDLAAF